MRRSILMVNVLATALWSTPGLAQQKKELGPLCATDTTSADQQIDEPAIPARSSPRSISGARLAGTRRATHPRHRRRHRGAQAQAGCRDLRSCAARPNTTRMNTTSRLPTSTTRCARAARRAASSTTTAATPGAPRATTPGRSPITMPPSNSIRRRSSPIRTAASPAGARRSRWCAKRSGLIRPWPRR